MELKNNAPGVSKLETRILYQPLVKLHEVPFYPVVRQEWRGRKQAPYLAEVGLVD